MQLTGNLFNAELQALYPVHGVPCWRQAVQVLINRLQHATPQPLTAHPHAVNALVCRNGSPNPGQ